MFVTIKRWWLLRFRGKDHEETKQEKMSWIDARTLAAALEKGFKWKVGPVIGSDIQTQSGVVIWNKWTDRPNSVCGQYISPGNANWSQLEGDVMRGEPGITKSQAERLSKLSVALHAKLSKRSNLADDSLSIFIGSPV